MADAPDREAALTRGDRLWDELRGALDAHLHEPIGPSTNWTGREVYAHFARWQERTVAGLRAVLEGRPPRAEHEDEDVLNDRWRIEDRALDATVARDRCLASRAELRGMLIALTDRQWAAFGHLFAPDIDGQHYEHHLAATRAVAGP
jgi:hypothetical protein